MQTSKCQLRFIKDFTMQLDFFIHNLSEFIEHITYIEIYRKTQHNNIDKPVTE